jgi:hypothetical protein
VLEHGAWADTSSWNGVIKRLQADGYTVYAPPNPLQGLTYDSAFLADFLHTISGPMVGTTDHAIPPARQLAMAENAHAHITEVSAPHLSMISDPGVVTSVILQAVQATT